MSPADPLIHPADPAPADRETAARARIERQMAKLERLAEIGMEIAEAAGRRAAALADGCTDAEAADPGLSYARAARAVRLTLALQSRLADDLAALDRQDHLARVGEASRRRHRIHRLVEAAAEAEGHDADEVERLESDAWERLTDVDDSDILDRPIDEVVAQICRDLGLSPDWAGSTFAADGSAAPDAVVPEPEPPPDDQRATVPAGVVPDRPDARSRASPALTA